ncbi:Transmembrane_domain-containing protein [Hexamita inflata]|uniref:Transmembrane domain-containing protein n=1 Tax=Hexamita inflata TaxID=28002 RepID=A0AA86V126_9EUKA|nr:Transmembrane domain-containing protein [Hexamita inflata]CAI9972102.1 Transmembrane domain-containing protein [Hexamita inflata]
MNYTEQLCKSELISSKTLLFLRIFSVIAHIVAVVLGLYTRRKIFIYQFTNWANTMTTIYSILVLFININYSKNVTISYQRVSRLALRILRVFAPLHTLVTLTFWPFCFKNANLSHGIYDQVYFVFSHGVTLFFLVIEIACLNFRMKWFNMYQQLVIFLYGIVMLNLYHRTGIQVYTFMHLEKSENFKYLFSFFPIIVIFNLLFTFVTVTIRRIIKKQNSKSLK